MPEWKQEIRRRLEGLDIEPAREGEIVEELAQHLGDRYEELLLGGATATEARRAALAELSGSDLLTRELRRVERIVPTEPAVLGARKRNMPGDLWNDLRYGVRVLLKNRGFTLIAVITLALGIGANTAIFSVVNSVLLRPLPYRQPERIVAIQELGEDGKRIQVTPANFLDWRAQNTVFKELAAILTRTANLALEDEAERLNLAVVSADFFAVFGVEAEKGRVFIPEDERAGHSPVVVLSYGLWNTRFGGDPEIVAKPITLDGKSYTVVGIAPQGFQYPDKTDVWVPPLRLVPELNERMDVTQVRGFGFLSAVALLNPGVSVAQAAGEMETITARLREQCPDTNNQRFNRVVSLRAHLVGETGTMLMLLLGAVAFVLLIACANVANLLLVRASSRQKEMAIRAALGASRRRAVQQLLTESTILALAGGGVGLFVAWWGVNPMIRLLPKDFPRLHEIRLDLRVLTFTLGASLLTGFIFGLVPALQASKIDVHQSLKESSRGASGNLRHNRLRQLLIVAEVSMSLVLLTGAGLMFRSFIQLQAVDAGFIPKQVLTARLSPGPTMRRDAEYVAFYNQVIQRIGAIPGVDAVGAINTLPLTKGPTAAFRIEGRPELTPDKWPGANYRSVSSDYFHAMSIPVVRGRGFTDQDKANAPLVMLINQALADSQFPHEDPIGKRITFGGTDRAGQPVWFEIVGVAGNVRSLELTEEAAPEFYLSFLQDPFDGMSVVIRSAVEPSSLASALRGAVHEVDRSQPVSEVETMKRLVSAAVTQPRFNLLLLGIFGGIALLLSAAGIYGVTAYSVSQRVREIGIRVSLGAQRADVLKLIIGQGISVAMIGICVGLAAALALTRVMSSLLYGVTATDPVTYAAVAFALAAVTLVACYVPARSAMKVDPLTALRHE